MTDKELDEWEASMRRYIRDYVDDKAEAFRERSQWLYYYHNCGIAFVKEWRGAFPSFTVWKEYDDAFQKALTKVWDAIGNIKGQ